MYDVKSIQYYNDSNMKNFIRQYSRKTNRKFILNLTKKKKKIV